MTTCEFIRGISGLVKLCMIDGPEFFRGHISDRFALVRAEPHKGYVTESRAQRHSAKAWLQGHEKSGHFSDGLPQKGTPEVLYLYL